ncbi:MAG: hypothetical protein FJX77_11400, partial [Armatimonadetes bacterium]|nr:hypothetical protein [Armatimonadota bacterium]
MLARREAARELSSDLRAAALLEDPVEYCRAVEAEPAPAAGVGQKPAPPVGRRSGEPLRVTRLHRRLGLEKPPPETGPCVGQERTRAADESAGGTGAGGSLRERDQEMWLQDALEELDEWGWTLVPEVIPA